MIRRAEEKDIGRLNDLLYQVQAIHAEGRPDIFKTGAKKYTDAELATLLADDRSPVFVWEEGNRVAGYAFCVLRVTEENPQLHGRKTLYIDDLCVDREDRGKGIGKELFDYAAAYARQEGCDSVTLNVWELNRAAEAFYGRMGMRPLKTMMELPLRDGTEED